MGQAQKWSHNCWTLGLRPEPCRVLPDHGGPWPRKPSQLSTQTSPDLLRVGGNHLEASVVKIIDLKLIWTNLAFHALVPSKSFSH